MSKVLRYTSRILWVLALIVLTAATATKGQTQVPDARVDLHLTIRSDDHNAPLLVSAVRDGDVEAVRSLLRQGAYANAAEGDGLSTLHWAARSGEPEIAKILLDAGATVDARTRNGAYTPLHEASKAGNALVARVLLEAGADPAARTTAGGATPLHFAAISGSAAAVKVLLESGAEIDSREGESEQTPLTWAAASNRLETVSALLDGGADPNAATKVVDVVKVFEDVRKARELYEKRKKSGDAESDAGVVTAEDSESTGDEVEQSEPRVLTFADLVSKKGGLTPFLLAARQGHRDVVMRLLDVGADINHQAAEGSSPLLIATINGHFDLGLELLERGADPNLPAHSGIAPLYAAINLQLSPISMYPQPTGHMEQEVEYRDYMRALLEAGAEPNASLKMRPWFEEHMESKLVDPSGATPFWRAAYALDVKTMRMLVDYGADPTIPSVRTPSRSRLDREQPDGGEAIDHSGMPPVPVGGPSNTPLHVAAGAGHGDHGSGPVHRHVPGGWMPAVRYLMEEIGLDVNARDHDGLTPLHSAAGRGDTTMIRYLVEHGADPTLKSRGGLSTADFANSLITSVPPYPEAVELLRSLGSDFRNECAYC
jgi:ankyrin repeat protein